MQWAQTLKTLLDGKKHRQQANWKLIQKTKLFMSWL